MSYKKNLLIAFKKVDYLSYYSTKLKIRWKHFSLNKINHEHKLIYHKHRVFKNLYKSFIYRIRLYRVKRFRKVLYLIVVVNKNNRIVKYLGEYEPHISFFNKKPTQNYSLLNISQIKGKFLRINKNDLIYWLGVKKAVPDYFLQNIFEIIGIAKVDNQKLLYKKIKKLGSFFERKYIND